MATKKLKIYKTTNPYTNPSRFAADHDRKTTY